MKKNGQRKDKNLHGALRRVMDGDKEGNSVDGKVGVLVGDVSQWRACDTLGFRWVRWGCVHYCMWEELVRRECVGHEVHLGVYCVPILVKLAI